MSQYRIGTITLINGSNVVSGEATLWVSGGISPGYTIKKDAENAIYNIASVVDNSKLLLTVNYAGTTVSGEAYQITKDFTPNYNIPEIWAGDRDWPFHLTQALRMIDTILATKT